MYYNTVIQTSIKFNKITRIQNQICPPDMITFIDY